jgi:putative ABC transport system substrate-binding protein
MRRREFISLLGGVAAGGPLAARAQQGEHMRRIGVLLPASADDARFQTFVGAFLQELQSLGWSIGRNVRIDTRWATTNATAIRRQAAELVALTPDVILAHGASTLGPLLQATHTVPVVFPITADPVGAGFVDSLGRPGVKVEVTPVNMRDADEIERVLAAFARAPGGGLIVTGSAPAYNYSDLIITLAARHKLPAVYYEHSFVAAGGLMSYGPDFVDQYRQAAGYVDRILKGEKPADLPVQAPTKYELVINLKTAKALGLTVPPPLLARANEVIE